MAPVKHIKLTISTIWICDRAAERTLVCAISVNSAFKSGESEPPVPAKDRLKSGLLEFPNLTSPVWAINPSITR